MIDDFLSGQGVEKLFDSYLCLLKIGYSFGYKLTVLTL